MGSSFFMFALSCTFSEMSALFYVGDFGRFFEIFSAGSNAAFSPIFSCFSLASLWNRARVIVSLNCFYGGKMCTPFFVRTFSKSGLFYVLDFSAFLFIDLSEKRTQTAFFVCSFVQNTKQGPEVPDRYSASLSLQ